MINRRLSQKLKPMTKKNDKFNHLEHCYSIKRKRNEQKLLLSLEIPPHISQTQTYKKKIRIHEKRE